MADTLDPKTIESRVVVVDVLFEDTAETATERLSEPYRNGFHIHRAIEWPGGMRVVFVQSGKTGPKQVRAEDLRVSALRKNVALRPSPRHR